MISVSPGLHRLRRVGLGAAIFSFALVAWGAIVRINGAGMTCPDWPKCRGVWFPAYDPKAVYEVSHRYGAAILTIVVVATFLAALAARREAPSAYRGAWIAIALIVAQVAAGAITIVRSNDPPSVAIHLVLGFATFACLTVVTLLAYLAPETAPAAGTPKTRLQMSRAGFARLALASALLAFGAVFAAGFMSASNDGLACTGFPLCAGLLGAQT